MPSRLIQMIMSVVVPCLLIYNSRPDSFESERSSAKTKEYALIETESIVKPLAIIPRRRGLPE